MVCAEMIEISSIFWYRVSNEDRVLSICIENAMSREVNITIYQRTFLGTSANQKRHYLKSYNESNWYIRLCILWHSVQHALWTQLFSKYCSKVKSSVILYTWEYSQLCTLFVRKSTLVRCMSSCNYSIHLYNSKLWTCNCTHLFFIVKSVMHDFLKHALKSSRGIEM
jgi:hypothetical protein